MLDPWDAATNRVGRAQRAVSSAVRSYGITPSDGTWAAFRRAVERLDTTIRTALPYAPAASADIARSASGKVGEAVTVLRTTDNRSSTDIQDTLAGLLAAASELWASLADAC